jgi:hypothetical protein
VRVGEPPERAVAMVAVMVEMVVAAAKVIVRTALVAAG